MRIAIVEDEAVVARRLVRMLGEIAGGPEVAEIEVRPTLAAALELVRGWRCDVLFLDLNLGGEDGFRVLEQAAAGPFETVVVSAHHDQALRAFDYGVADFVAKPWSAERLRIAFDRALGKAGRPGGGARSLVIRRGREVLAIAIERVVFARGADDYSELHLADGTMHLHEKSLAGLESLLPSQFMRIHRSYLVDVDRLRSLRTAEGGRLWAVLEGGQALPVGRLYREATRARFAPA
jgi:DNA-binding LytR/AlgR family response regulator